MSVSSSARRHKHLSIRKSAMAWHMSVPVINSVGGLDAHSGNQLLVLQAVRSAASSGVTPMYRVNSSQTPSKRLCAEP